MWPLKSRMGIHGDQFNCKLPNSRQWITKLTSHYPRSSTFTDTFKLICNLFYFVNFEVFEVLRPTSTISLELWKPRWPGMFTMSLRRTTEIFFQENLRKRKRATGENTFSNRVICLLVDWRPLDTNYKCLHQEHSWPPAGSTEPLSLLQ